MILMELRDAGTRINSDMERPYFLHLEIIWFFLLRRALKSDVGGLVLDFHVIPLILCIDRRQGWVHRAVSPLARWLQCFTGDESGLAVQSHGHPLK